MYVIVITRQKITARSSIYSDTVVETETKNEKKGLPPPPKKKTDRASILLQIPLTSKSYRVRRKSMTECNELDRKPDNSSARAQRALTVGGKNR